MLLRVRLGWAFTLIVLLTISNSANAQFIKDHARTYINVGGPNAGTLNEAAPFFLSSSLDSGSGLTAYAICDGYRPRLPLSVQITAFEGDVIGDGGAASAIWYDRISLIPTRPGLPTPTNVRVNVNAFGANAATSPSGVSQGAAGYLDDRGITNGLNFTVENGVVTSINAYPNVDSYTVTPGVWSVNYHYDSPLSSDGGYYFGIDIGIAMMNGSPLAPLPNGAIAHDPFFFTLSDGNTPEEDGYLVKLDSGMRSPDVVPEPATLILLGIGGSGLLGYCAAMARTMPQIWISSNSASSTLLFS